MSQANLHGSNINQVKLHNLQVVLLSLLYEPVLSRVQLARRTNLSNTTITNLVAELISQGIIAEIDPEAGEEPGQRAVGRPRTRIQLVTDARFVLGIHIGVGIFRVGLTNLRAEIRHSETRNFSTGAPAGEVLEQIVALVETVIRSSGVPREHILGAGVGASGLVDFNRGVNLLAPNLNWSAVPLRDILQDRLHLPVIVDNNVRTMAIAETYFGAGIGVDTVAFVYGRMGVGAGLTFKGRVFRGSSKGAGEIGHWVMLVHDGEPCRCGNSGCLETLVSESSILRRAEALARSEPGGILARLLQENPEMPPIEKVFQAARQGDCQARELIEERATYLGVALANLVNLINPDLILLGGIFSSASDLFVPRVSRTIQEKAFGGMGKNVRLQATSFGWKAGVVGAAALALLHFFYQPSDECAS